MSTYVDCGGGCLKLCLERPPRFMFRAMHGLLKALDIALIDKALAELWALALQSTRAKINCAIRPRSASQCTPHAQIPHHAPQLAVATAICTPT